MHRCSCWWCRGAWRSKLWAFGCVLVSLLEHWQDGTTPGLNTAEALCSQAASCKQGPHQALLQDAMQIYIRLVGLHDKFLVCSDCTACYEVRHQENMG